MAAVEEPTSSVPNDADDLLKRSLPEALGTLLCLQDNSNKLTDELTMRAWESMHFCFEAMQKQITSMCDDFDSLPGRRGVISALQALSNSLQESISARLASLETKPRLYRLSEDVGFSTKELRAFIYVLMCSDQGEYIQSRDRNRLCRKFSGMSRTEFFAFTSSDRKHMKQGLICAQREFDDSFQGKTVPAPVIKALYGGELSFNEAMTVASSAIAGILAVEKNTVFSMVNGCVSLGGILVGDSKETINVDEEKEDHTPSTENLEADHEKMTALIWSLADETPEPAEKTDDSEEQTKDSEDMCPYKTDLEYLSDGISVVVAAADHFSKSSGKEEFLRFDMRKKNEASEKREAELKYKKAESKFKVRLLLTMKAGVFFPKLERLVKKLGLSHFERLVILSLIANILNPKMTSLLKMSTFSTFLRIRMVIRILCNGDLEKEIQARSSFYKSSRLVSSGVIFLQTEKHGHGFPDLGDLICCLDRMLFDYILGLETELSEIMESAKCYAPDICMDTVILPTKLKQLAIERVENFETFRKLRKKLGFDDIVRYGKGLSLFFHGKSGTGKTLFANSLASHLGRKVVLIDVNSLHRTQKMSDAENLRIIFREARVQNAIVFMDECDGLLQSRHDGGGRVATILHEMENFDGIVILATNRPQSLDEAMHRRIALSLEFPEPDAQMRLAIWQRHIPDSMTLAHNVSLEELAIEFELTGGFIKNAIFEALASAVTRVMKNRRGDQDVEISKTGEDLEEKDVQLTMEDLRLACNRQSRADLNRTKLQRRIIPVAGLDTLVAGDEAKTVLREVVDVERVRRVLATRWGFKGQQARSNFIVIMGPHGSGKTHAAACLGFETGRPLQTLSMPEILRKGPSAYEIGKVFAEAALAGAVVVIEQGEQLMLEAAVQENIASQGLELLYNIKSYSGLVVLCVTTADTPSDAGWMTHAPTPNRIAMLLSYLVKLKKPNRTQRLQLWKQLIPEDTPCAPDVEETLEKIASKYDTTGARILACINRAAAAAARRGNTSLSVNKSSSECVLTGKDLIDSCEAEVDLVHATNTTAAWVRALYV